MIAKSSVGVAFVAVAYYLLFSGSSGSSSSSADSVQSGGDASSSGTAEGGLPEQLLPPMAHGTAFSKSHNDSLLWGTYRPNIIFGVKSRTFPQSLVAGFMWSQVDSSSGVQESTLRHTCEESETREGLKFGYSEHDGASYGTQTITDPGNGLEMQTTFIKPTSASNEWVMRVSSKGSKDDKTHALFFYFAIDNEYGGKSGPNDGFLLNNKSSTDDALVAISGFSSHPGISDFNIHVVSGDSKTKAHVFGTSLAGEGMVKLKETLLSSMVPSEGSNKKVLTKSSVSGDTNLVFVQLEVGKGAFEFDVVYQGGSDGKAELSTLTGSSLANLISQRSADFHSRFERTFNIQSDDKKRLQFAKAALSAMLGGLGYFYGSSTIKESYSQYLAPPKPLFSAVPSRSFFPRGFLWDEGFHQLLISRWSPSISKDVLAHWFALQHSDGWIPREQILGAEARAKVPKWAIPQHRTHANPPTFLLVVENLLSNGGGDSATEDERWLSQVFPALVRWYEWFRRSQAGKEKNSFLWRGRDPNDGKLNPMTLSSGLDDYPRASEVSEDERHVDLHCWMAMGAKVLARVGQRLVEKGLVDDEEGKVRVQKLVDHYGQLAADLEASLDALHWNAKKQLYADFGLHSNKGKYAKHIVVKCAARDNDGDQVEHHIPPRVWKALQQGKPASQAPCPPSHPQFKWPLGDGKGGLLMREKFIPKQSELKRPRFVDHIGYVSLFPLFMMLVPADDGNGSTKLGHLLDLLSDDDKDGVGLWSDYGIRSLASTDKMYLRENAPGDAPYWRGPIWINCNFLAVRALSHYSMLDGPHQQRAKELYEKLKENLTRNMAKSYSKTGYLWEQYNPSNGDGQRTHPFNGWSSLIVAIMAQQ